jgi:type II secretory pathway pseudopilin PulG
MNVQRLHAPTPLSSRSGLTLVEVLLVLALLVVIGAVSAPLLEGAFSRAELQSAGEIVRGAWTKARLAAMQTGQIYVFRFEPAGSRFQIVALNELGLPESNDLPPADPTISYEAADTLRLPQTRLPEGVVFASGDIAPSSLVLATLPGAETGAWSAPIVFRSDGTTTDASLLLTNERQQTIRVTLRGLTGISDITDVAAEVLP